MARTVLVVDDDPLVLEVTESMLQQIGCTVVSATTPSQALVRIVEDPSIEILITDINMPRMDGYELAQRAKQLRENLKVILLSGGEVDGRGFPLIRKPFLEADLVRTMERTTGLC